MGVSEKGNLEFIGNFYFSRDFSSVSFSVVSNKTRKLLRGAINE